MEVDEWLSILCFHVFYAISSLKKVKQPQTAAVNTASHVVQHLTECFKGFFFAWSRIYTWFEKITPLNKKKNTCTVCYVIYTWKLYWIVLNESLFCNNTSLMFFIMLICFMIYVYIRNINENALYLATLKDFNNDLGPWQIHTCPWFTWNTES